MSEVHFIYPAPRQQLPGDFKGRAAPCVANSIFFRTQLPAGLAVAATTEFANRGKLSGKVANSMAVMEPAQSISRSIPTGHLPAKARRGLTKPGPVWTAGLAARTATRSRSHRAGRAILELWKILS